MKTIIVNPKLDTEDITESALDYALFTQICRVKLGFNSNRNEDADRYEKMLDRYPARNEAEKILRNIEMSI